MKRKHKKTMLLVTGTIGVIVATAGATSYIATDMARDLNSTTKQTTADINSETKSYPMRAQVEQNSASATQAPATQVCEDGNIVGKVLGGAAGGVVGSQFGKGNGKTAATIGGTVGGALVGEKYIPTDGATCR